MSGWWLDYSYTCQPVDYSQNQKALRVSILKSTFLLKTSRLQEIRVKNALCARLLLALNNVFIFIPKKKPKEGTYAP